MHLVEAISTLLTHSISDKSCVGRAQEIMQLLLQESQVSLRLGIV